jgi:hypothetical protein
MYFGDEIRIFRVKKISFYQNSIDVNFEIKPRTSIDFLEEPQTRRNILEFVNFEIFGPREYDSSFVVPRKISDLEITKTRYFYILSRHSSVENAFELDAKVSEIDSW